MLIKNKITRPFGPAGTTAGITIFIIGAAYAFFSLVGILLIIIGAFIGFTTEQSFIDTEKRRIKFSNVLFGIFPAGKWIDLNDEMTIGIERSRMGFRTYSRGMRINDTVIKDVRIVLYDSKGKRTGALKKCKTLNSANKDLEDLGRSLKIKVKQ